VIVSITHHSVVIMTPERWQQIDNLLEEALKREPNERSTYLDQACAGDEALRLKVEALLAAHESAETFIEAPALEVAAQALAEQARSMVGQQLDHYRILSLIGKGGMGEVYRARDSRIGREVAIKILPEVYSRDAERLRRFGQEARAAGMLNHPNIMVVHDIGLASPDNGGAPYIVSELLEGETLRTRINGSALAPHKAIDYALQIARGLAAAHEKGITHRDLKPENLFVMRDGRVKILDFGLAKLKPQAISGLVDTQAPSVAVPTAPGVIMGTVGYMSPEQASGVEADHRADIFAFGAILYEMLTGKRAFQGKTAIEVLNSILKEEPPELENLQRNFTPALGQVVRHCLEKNPPERFQSATDLAFALSALASPSGIRSDATGEGGLVAIASRFKRGAQQFWIATTAFLLIATVALSLLYYRRAPGAANAIRFSIYPPEQMAFDAAARELPHSMSVSPDGERLAFVTMSEGRTQLWVRALGSLSAQPFAGAEGARYPFWSPDSRFIGFFADGKLKKIEAAGGPPQTLCQAPRWGTIATWNREGIILFSTHFSIYRVSAEGGEPALVNKPDQTGEVHHLWPSFLPDGRRFIFTAGGKSKQATDLYLGSLDSDKITLLLRDASRAAYAPPGYLLYVRDGALLAHPFDVEVTRFTGEPILLDEGLWYFKPIGSADFSVSETGVLAYRTGTNVSRLIWFDRRGVEIGSTSEPKDYQRPRLSPNGHSFAVEVADPRNGTTDIWNYALSRSATRLTFEPGMENSPIWSPGGRQIVFAYDPDGPPHLYQKSLSETGRGEMLVPVSGGVQWPYDWTPNGQYLIYGDIEEKTGENLMYLAMSGERKPTRFLDSQFDETDARFSPDGRWVAYVSDETGRSEVYVCTFPGATDKRKISTAGGTSPRWRRDGTELFYIATNNRLMAVPVRTGTSFETGKATVLFRVDARDNQYDVAVDGQRFLINISVVEARFLPLTVVVNWVSGINR
jgi:Tol biopolymer transport system component